MSNASLTMTGTDCACGSPMIWRRCQPQCAVYGARHPDGRAGRAATGHHLVTLIDRHTWNET